MSVVYARKRAHALSWQGASREFLSRIKTPKALAPYAKEAVGREQKDARELAREMLCGLEKGVKWCDLGNFAGPLLFLAGEFITAASRECKRAIFRLAAVLQKYFFFLNERSERKNFIPKEESMSRNLSTATTLA